MNVPYPRGVAQRAWPPVPHLRWTAQVNNGGQAHPGDQQVDVGGREVVQVVAAKQPACRDLLPVGGRQPAQIADVDCAVEL